ncbi:clathrin light chain [Tetranychus urticae]|uniref:Clathrin light chain n=1 Tax=Tetranychus urticae TaxID=32264 RepID=T1KPH3_TETUR|nr:clathrin light chain [Tetranychus urticae]
MDLDSFVKIEDIDPAADFLAREQDMLSELESDFTFSVEATTLKQEPTELPDLTITDENENENVVITNIVEEDDLTSSNHETSNNEPTNTLVNGQTNGFTEVYTEPEKISRWRAASVAMLQEKDEEEAKRKEELLEQAKAELEDWYAQYNDQLNKWKANNRNAEAEWIAERDAEVPGKEWEKITKMCDFNPKPNQKGAKDTSRMRSLLVHLKQNPPLESA